jgi:hypothetical protein
MQIRGLQTAAGVFLTISAAVLLSVRVGSPVWIGAAAMSSFFGIVWLATALIKKDTDKIEEMHLIERDLRHQADLHADSSDGADD